MYNSETILCQMEEHNLQVFNNKVDRKIRGLVGVEESTKLSKHKRKNTAIYIKPLGVVRPVKLSCCDRPHV
jgi:hypothetical protein